MEHDSLFRTLLLAGYAVVLPVAAFFRIRSHVKGERLDRRQEGLFILIPLRLLGVIGMTAIVAWLINPSWMHWSAVPLPTWLRWVGVFLSAAAGSLLVWTLLNLGKNLTDTVVTRRAHTLVTTGPYRYVRHPFYLAAALGMVGISLVTANWFIFAAGFAAITLLAIRTRKEEKNLVARFGDQYRSYMQRTGRFLPHLRRPG